HVRWRAIVLGGDGREDWFGGDDARLRETAGALVALSEEQGFPFYLAIGRCHLGWLAARDGDLPQGLELLRAGLSDIHSNDTIWGPYSRGMMSEVLTWAGNPDDAQALLDEALNLSALTGSAWFDAELLRRQGEVLLARARP